MDAMKPFYTILLLILIPVSLMAQQDPEAKAILDKMSELIKSWPSVYAHYEYQYHNVRTNDDYTTKGEVWVRGDMYKLTIENNESEVYFDGETMWNYIVNSKEVNVSIPDKKQTADFFIQNPLELFTLYAKDYKIRYIRDIPGTSTCEIDLYPYDLKKMYQRIRLTIDKNLHQLEKAKASGKGGETYEVTLSGLKQGGALPDSFFRFDSSKHPGVELIDLRL